ncbi:MAG: UvrD-helicase domain-containing protein, partial [Clostridia bacterium]|nr:UvrD-helicase domain-containing protein [Clostridia bacterium]
MAWTDEQQKAIEAKGSVIVSAAAGSGKTAVLTERIARLIAGGTDIDRFLVVTFTRSAAAEMKKRIADKLREMAEGAADAPRLMQAAADIGRADISTIDAFCARVLRRHFQGAGLDPAFRAAEETEAEALRREAMEELIEESLGDKQFDRLVNAFDGEEGFTEAAFKLYDFLCAQPDPMGWLKAAAEMPFAEDDLETTPMMEEYLARAKAAALRRADMLKVRRDEIADDYPQTAKLLEDDIAMVNELVRLTSYTAYAKRLNAMEFPRFAMKGADKELRDHVNGVRTKLRDEIKEQREKYFALPLSAHAQRLRDIRPLTECLYSFMEKYFALYAEKKREEGLIDYADMEHMALKLLRDPAIAKEYRDRFDYVFVDEYQDCNPVQNEIFAALSREDDQFYVGDVKQSIYRFRMAEAALFTEKFDALEKNGGALLLSKNFRSSTAVIDYVNSLFSKIMTRHTGGVDYDVSARLTAGRAEKGGAELHILPRSLAPEYLEDAPEDELSVLAAAEAEALFAAGRIRELVNSTFTDRDGTQRNYRYNDIVVLHSSPASIAEVWVRTLSREGVPAYAEMTGGYFEAIEVQVFLNLLRIIDNPLQDIPLISVLRSPVGGFDTEELILLRTDCPADSFYS